MSSDLALIPRTELVTTESNLPTLADLEHQFALASRQRELLETYIRERLKPEKHYYQVQGNKNSLTKEGAELICLPHGLVPDYEVIGGPLAPPQTDEPYQMVIKCSLMKGSQFAGSGIGSASSHVTRRDGTVVPRQPDRGLRHNATLKMAQKSGYIAATLNATAASEFYTQDMEDSHDAPQNAQEPQGGAKPLKMMCPTCKKSEMWDNRFNKKNPKAPDFKCKDKTCDGVIWHYKEEPEQTEDLSLIDQLRASATADWLQRHAILAGYDSLEGVPLPKLRHLSNHLQKPLSERQGCKACAEPESPSDDPIDPNDPFDVRNDEPDIDAMTYEALADAVAEYANLDSTEVKYAEICNKLSMNNSWTLTKALNCTAKDRKSDAFETVRVSLRELLAWIRGQA